MFSTFDLGLPKLLVHYLTTSLAKKPFEANGYLRDANFENEARRLADCRPIDGDGRRAHPLDAKPPLANIGRRGKESGEASTDRFGLRDFLPDIET
jgi:hypothetical protein